MTKKQVRKKNPENGQSSINQDKLSIIAESIQVKELLSFVSLCRNYVELRGRGGGVT